MSNTVPIHEGTNGIQALDLLGRKVWMHNSAGLKLLAKNIMTDIAKSKELEKSASTIGNALDLCDKVTQHLGASMATEGADKTLAKAGCYLSIMGKLVFS